MVKLVTFMIQSQVNLFFSHSGLYKGEEGREDSQYSAIYERIIIMMPFSPVVKSSITSLVARMC